MIHFENKFTIADLISCALAVVAIVGLVYTHQGYKLSEEQHRAKIQDLRVAFEKIKTNKSRINISELNSLRKLAEFQESGNQMNAVLLSGMKAQDSHTATILLQILKVQYVLHAVILRFREVPINEDLKQLLVLASELSKYLYDHQVMSLLGNIELKKLSDELDKKMSATKNKLRNSSELSTKLDQHIKWFQSENDRFIGRLDVKVAQHKRRYDEVTSKLDLLLVKVGLATGPFNFNPKDLQQ